MYSREQIKVNVVVILLCTLSMLLGDRITRIWTDLKSDCVNIRWIFVAGQPLVDGTGGRGLAIDIPSADEDREGFQMRKLILLHGHLVFHHRLPANEKNIHGIKPKIYFLF